MVPGSRQTKRRIKKLKDKTQTASKEIQLSEKNQREEFLKIPFVASHSYHNWIPGLRFIHRQLIDPEKNPFLKQVNHHFFIAEKDGKSLGRMALFGPGHWPGNGKIATIGFVDFPDDQEIYASLFFKAENKAIELGASFGNHWGFTGPGFEEYKFIARGLRHLLPLRIIEFIQAVVLPEKVFHIWSTSLCL